MDRILAPLLNKSNTNLPFFTRTARANDVEHLIQSRLLRPFGLARIEDAETEHLDHMKDWVWKLSVGECAYGSLGLPSERLIAVMGNTTNADKLGNITCQ